MSNSLNSTSSEMPNTRYGITSGENTSAENARLARGRPGARARYEASTPSATAKMLVTVATIALRCSAASSAGFFAANWYHGS